MCGCCLFGIARFLSDVKFVLFTVNHYLFAVTVKSFTAKAPLLSFTYTRISNVPADDGLKVADVAEPNFVHAVAVLLL